MYAIEIKGVSKSFGRIRAVSNLDLKVKKGIVFGLIGPNGSGKTTTIRMFCSLLRPDTGSISVLGSEVGKDDSYMRKLGYMPQETALYDGLTVEENLKLFGGLYGLEGEGLQEAEDRVLGLVNLSDRRGFLVSDLSGGQKHRVSLAASMLHSPELLVLDEPTVGVDPPLRAKFWKTFADLKKAGSTILMSTHYMDEAHNCDIIGMMRQGSVIAMGTPKEIMTSTKTKSLEDAFLYLVDKGGVQ